MKADEFKKALDLARPDDSVEGENIDIFFEGNGDFPPLGTVSVTIRQIAHMMRCHALRGQSNPVEAGSWDLDSLIEILVVGSRQFRVIG